MRNTRERTRGNRIIFGWLFAAWLALAAVAGIAAEQRYVYDELGRLIAVIDPAGETTHYTYDEAGNLTSVSRASSAQVSIVSFSPTRGRSGDTVTIFGTGFSATPALNAVTFNGTPALVSASTTTSIVTTVPVAAASGPIHVTTPTGSAASAQAFLVVVPQPPTITAFTPAIVAPNGSFVISGSAFEPVPSDNQVRVNASTSVVIAATDEALTARAPNASGGKVTVTTSNGSTASTADLFIVPPPNAAADVAATARISLDAPGAVLSVPAGRIGLALFDGTAGAVGVKVSVRDVTISNGTVTVYAPNGTTLASTSFGTGGATLSLPTLLATGSYGVRVTSSGGNATVAAWRDVSGSLAVGVPVDITFTNPGQQARFTFTAASGDLFGIDLSNIALAGNTGVRVLRPDGAAVIDTTIGSSGAGFRVPQGAAGEYTVILTPAAGGTGSLRLTLWKDVVGALALETPFNVAIGFRNQQARLTFTAAAGDFLGLELASVAFPGGNTGVRVLRPDGAAVIDTTIGSSGAGFRVPPGAAGTYTVIIIPPAAGTGSLNITLWRDAVGELEPEAPFHVAIDFRNQQGRLSFTAAAGEFVGLDLSSVAFAGGNTGVRVLRPDGAAVIDTTIGPSGAGFRVPQGAAGTYTVIIIPPAASTGSLSITLWRDVTTALQPETPFDAEIGFRNQQARLTFTAAPGDLLGLDLTNVAFAAGNTGIRVLRPDGAAVIDTTIGSSGAGFRIPQGAAGTYTAIITPPAASTGSLRVTLWRDVTGTLQPGAAFNVAIGFRNQQAQLTFTAVAGQFYGIDLSAVAFSGGNTGVRVLRPDGAAVIDTTISSSGAGFRVPQGAAGVYTVIIIPPAAGTGSLQLTLWRDVSDTLLFDTPYALTIPFRNQQARFTITAAASDNLGIDLSNVTLAQGSGIRVLRPDGAAVIDTTFSSGAGAGFRIPPSGAGTYTVIIIPAGGGTGDARVTLWRDIGGTFELGAPVDLNVAYRNQAIRMTYAASAQQLLGVDIASVGFGGGIRVLRPDGAAVVDTSFAPGAGGGFRIPQGAAGIYTVVVTPASGATGAIRLALWEDVGGALAIGPQIDVAVPFRNQQMRKTFVASLGQNLGVDLSDFAGFTNGGIRVLRADGAVVVDTSFAGAAGGSFRIPTVNIAGTYTVIVTPGSGATGTFRLRLWSDVTDALTIGTTYALSIPVRNQQARLPFASAGGETLTLELSAIAFPAGGSVSVLRPDGATVISTSFGGSGFSQSIPGPSQAGTYTVLIVPGSGGTGTMNVRVFRP